MGNHCHLLVETPGANLVSRMQWLQTAYTVWFNRRHGLGGHLFGGRYKAVPIDEPEPQANMLCGYLRTVLDYLHVNPVRAGIVGRRSNKCLLDYRWSGLTGAYLCSPRKRPKWAHVEMVFPLFGLKDNAAGRRGFLERLELRVQEEHHRADGPGPINAAIAVNCTVRSMKLIRVGETLCGSGVTSAPLACRTPLLHGIIDAHADNQ